MMAEVSVQCVIVFGLRPKATVYLHHLLLQGLSSMVLEATVAIKLN